MTAPVRPRRLPRGRSLARRLPAASHPHIAAADRHLPAAVEAVAGLLSSIKVNATTIRAYAGVTSPEFVAHLAGPVEKKLSPLEGALSSATFDAGASLKFDAGFDLTNDLAVAYARERAGELISGINQETRKLIAQVVASGQAGQLSAGQIAKQVQGLVGLSPAQAQAAQAYRRHLEQVGANEKSGKQAAGTVAGKFGLSPWKGGKLDPAKIDKLVDQYKARQLKQRAETIARTEMIRAAEAGSRLAWQKAINEGGADGMILVREWSVTRDDRACPVCLRLDGETVRSHESLPGIPAKVDDMRFPGGLQGPPVHPRCRCTILTTLELPDGTPGDLLELPPEPEREPEPPEPEPPTWAETMADRRAKAARKVSDARGDGGMVPSRKLATAERELTKVGKEVNAEIDRRAEAAGAKPFGKTQQGQLDRAKAAEEKTQTAFIKAVSAESTATPAEKARARKAWEKASNKRHDLLETKRGWEKARRKGLREVLGELRPMGGSRFDISDHDHPGAANFAGKMADVADRFPTEWLDASNRRGRIRVQNADQDAVLPGRAYYLDSKGLVSLTPRQANDLGESTATHEFMHRMEYTMPDIKAAEWAFWQRRKGTEPTRTIAALTGNSAYGANEVGIGDDFDNPYMGKVYDRGGEREDQAWEVMTMGVESVYYGSHVIDEDYRSFVLGVLSTL